MTSPLSPQQLFQACDPAGLPFQTTAELPDLGEMIGQARALDAVRFGAGIRHDGYNIYVLGPAGMGKRSLVLQYLGQQARAHAPADWCYIHNFTQPHKPLALKLPPGRGAELRRQMEQLVDYLRTAIPALFESEEYSAKAQALHDEFNKQHEHVFKNLSEQAQAQNIALLRTPSGFGLAPTRDGEVMPPDEFTKLSEAEQQRYGAAMEKLQEQLEKIVAHMPQWLKERGELLKNLNRETTLSAVALGMKDLRAGFADLPEVLRYLDAVQQDMVEHADDFRKTDESPSALAGLTGGGRETFSRYQVNVLVTNGADAGVPIVSEDNPTYTNLLGRVEHIASFGALVTNFTLIKPGALHQANGGYLLLDARKVLLQPFAWDGLKRALQSRVIRIESLGQMYSLVSTVSLEPEPMALDVKIVLFGDRLTYYLLQEYDPEFGELFKVAADFEEHIERNAESHLLYARLIATLARRSSLLPFARDAVARVIEHGARRTGDAQHLSTHVRSIADLLQEADYQAREAGRAAVTAADVQQAIDAGIRRQDRVRGLLHEAILHGTLMIDTSGAVRGQINALSVIELGGFAFAQPTRVTATSRLGEGEMLNIEREVKLSGALHSKGVLILSSFLAARFARSQPLALSASLVFEQSYALIDGDSASLAELCVLLAELAGVPVTQSLAVTGSVNQLGQVQAIGAVNEKIEGFFDICAARGLTGEQGVVIPATNVRHLMLRHDVVAAAEAGRFHIYAVTHVDQALALLTGLPAGEPAADGRYPEGSVNARVAARMAELAELRRKMADRTAGRSGGKDAAAGEV